MNWSGIFLVVFIFIYGITGAQQIAITFDDVPKSDGRYYTGIERTKILIQKLEELGISEAAFFCNTKNRDSSALARVNMYSESGHIIANHSHSHLSLNRISAKDYAEDILITDRILSRKATYKKWFRFPFLHEGNTIEKRDSIRSFLAENNFISGYVTVDNYEWYIDSILKKALSEGSKIDYDKFGDLYVEHLWESIKFYDNIGKETLGRSPKHILLLHENDCAALFLDKLISHIRSNGWEIIPVSQAYEDPIAEYLPETLFNGQGRVAAIAHEKGVLPNKLVQDSEVTGYLDNKFQQAIKTNRNNEAK